jgi:hypothetical protein
MCKYHEVAKVVEPKIAALRAAEAELKVGWCRATQYPYLVGLALVAHSKAKGSLTSAFTGTAGRS